MAANTNPIFELVPNNGLVSITAANTAKDGSGTITPLITGGTNGTRVDTIRFISAQATPAASSNRVGRIFLSKDSGTTWNLVDEVVITGATSSNTAAGDKTDITYPNGFILKDSTQILGCAMSVYAGVQDRTNVIARGGDF